MYRMMFIIGLILCILFFFLSLYIFWKNGIAKIIGDMTGVNAKRAMTRMKKEREEKRALQKNVTPKEIDLNTARLLEEMTYKEENESLKTKQPVLETTEKNAESSKKRISGFFEEEEDMMVLGGRNDKRVSAGDEEVKAEEHAESLDEPETGVLSSDAYQILLGDVEQTTLLSEDATDVLTEEQTMILQEEEGTEILTQEETEILLQEETTILEQEGETDVLFK
ncbi:MAG: hypothetical protein Q4D51_06780 [Eubacteriales bacterium]|nr:hypothetical protein [Eubacteriales bacterium]